MDLARNKIVLLFYQDHVCDTLFPGDRHIKQALRPIFHRFTKKQKVSGFLVWFQLLAKALRQQGYDVQINNYRLARSYPTYPVGLVGYPQILDGWRLPNPAVIGPGFFDHPKQAPHLLDDPRFRFYIVTCQWMEDLFNPFYRARCVRWHAGIDTAAWTDTMHLPKSIDVLIYDKIRWNRDTYEPTLLEPIVQHLEQRGLRYQIVRYGRYDLETYRSLLLQVRSMLFLCEHETQGMAYQEALASNVPILAWDNGFWLDSRRSQWEAKPVPASSVPYWGPECGERFLGIEEFKPTFDRFWSQLDSYQPRRYVERELSFARSAETYMHYYDRLIEEAA